MEKPFTLVQVGGVCDAARAAAKAAARAVADLEVGDGPLAAARGDMVAALGDEGALGDIVADAADAADAVALVADALAASAAAATALRDLL